MKIYERLGDSGFHTSIISTFGIDFDAYESIALTRLRAAGCRNNVVIVDENMLVSALDGTSALPRMAGRQYSVSGASAAGVFHPKLFLQIGRRKGRLMVASANTTATGLARNLELAGIIECTDKASDEQRIIASAWRYLAGRIDPEKHALARHIAWMQSRASWLRQAEVATGAVTLADGTTAAFLATGESTGVMNRFMALIGQDRIARLIVLSPYWDEDLAALRGLVSGLQPSESFLMIDGRRALFPGPALKHVPAAQLVDLASFGKGRFIHAKLIIASSADVDHVLFGSANCTVAALGTPTFAGANEEACLYRRLPTGEAIAALGLDAVLAEGQTLDGQTLPPLIAANDLEADETGRRNPGVFECADDTLTWWAPNAAISSTARIELLDKDGAPIECVLEPMVGIVGGTSRFRIIGAKKRPDFARLRFPIGSESAIAVIARIESLIAAARDYESKAAKKAAERLDEETEIDLSLLEVLDDLEAAEAAEVRCGLTPS